MMKLKKGFLALILLALVCISGFLVQAHPDVDVGGVLLKVSASKGEVAEKEISIFSDSYQKIDIEIVRAEGVSIAEESFILNKGETKKVKVIFDSTGLEPGVYAGSIAFIDSEDTHSVPVVFEIETRDLFFDINFDIPTNYLEVYPGESLFFETTIYDLTSGGTAEGLGTSSVSVEYAVYSSTGERISFEEESVVVKGQTKASKSLNLPRSLEEGDYVLASLVRYGSSVGVGSDYFSVARKPLFDFDFDGDGRFIYILLVVAVFFVVVVAVFFYFLRERDRFILELNKYNTKEMRKQTEMLISQARIVKARAKIKPAEVDKEVKRKISELKKKQKKRVETIRGLRKRGKVDEIKRQIKKWEKQGYSTLTLGSNIKGLSNREMQNLLGEWKKKYQSEDYKKKK